MKNDESIAIPPGGLSLLESIRYKIAFRKLFSLLSLVVKDLESFTGGIADENIKNKI